MRNIFKNPQHQAEFDQNGYLILPLLEKEHISALWELYNNVTSGISNGFYASLYSSDTDYKTHVDTEVKKICASLPNKYLDNYRPLGGSFLVKLPGEASSLPVHQDWTIVDETQFTSINCWFPIMEVDAQNGPFMAMKGSHKLFNVLRGSPRFPSPLDGIRDVIKEKYLTQLEVKVGEVLFHSHKLVHASPPNNTTTARVVAGMNMIPAEAVPLHYYCNDNDLIELFEIDDRFYTHFNIGQRPSQYRKIKEIKNYKVPSYTTAQLEDLYFGKPGLLKRFKRALGFAG